MPLSQILILKIVSRPQIHYVAEDDLELLTLLSLPPGFWHSRHEPPCLASVALGMEARASCILGKHAPNPGRAVGTSGCCKQTQLRVFVAWFHFVFPYNGPEVIHIQNKIILPTLISS